MPRPYTREQLEAMTWDEIVDVGLNEYGVKNFWNKEHMFDWFVAKERGDEAPGHPPMSERMKIKPGLHRREGVPIPAPTTLVERLNLAGRGITVPEPPEPDIEDLDPVEALQLKERLAEQRDSEDDGGIPYRFEEKAPAMEPWKLLDLETGPQAIPRVRPQKPGAAVLEAVQAEPEPLPGGIIKLTAEQLATCFLCRVEPSGYAENMKCCATFLGNDKVRLSITDIQNGDRRYIITLPQEIPVQARPCI